MNENLLPKTPTIKEWLNKATIKMSEVNIPTSRLDAEIILSSVIKMDRSYLHSHPENILDYKDLKSANERLELRISRFPIAYIVGYKEFYGRQFIVDQSVLIPRPESETIIEVLGKIIENNKNLSNEKITLADIGTGSGCLGITAKLEFSNLKVILSDINSNSLKIAKKNAKSLSANVTIIKSDLLKDYGTNLDIIIANLPYVDKKWDRSPETDYEPDLALFAKKNGKALIEELISEAKNKVKNNGYLIIEADPCLHNELIKYAEKYFLRLYEHVDYVLVFKRLVSPTVEC